MSCDTAKVLTHLLLLALGTNGTRIVYPIRGIVQVMSEIQRQTQLYVLGLSVSAVALCVGLLLAGYRLGGDPWTILALIVVNAVAERSGVWLTRTTQMSMRSCPRCSPRSLRAAGRRHRQRVINVGRSRSVSRSDPDRAPRLKLASYASSRFITGAAAGFIAQGLLGITSSAFGGLMVTTLGAAFVAEGIDMLFAAFTARIRGRSIRGLLRTLTPLLAHVCPAVRPTVAVLALRIPGLTLDGAALLHSSASGPKTLRDVSASATARRGSEASEYVVRRGARGDAREERPIHSGTLKGRRHLLARHR